MPESRRVRIIHTIPDLIVGGGQHLLLRNITGMDRARVESIVCCICALGEMEAAYRAAGFRLECLNCTRGTGIPGAARHLAALIRREDIDIVHTNNTVSDRTVGQLAAWMTGRPVVNSLHSEHLKSDDIKGLRSVPRRMARALGVRLARVTVDHAVPVSESVRESWEPYLRAMGIDRERVTVVNPGLAPERFARPADSERAFLRKELGVEGAWPVLINVGRLNYHKGQHWLVPMMKTVVQRHPRARLLLVGDGQDRELLTESIRTHELHSVVTLLGQRSDITHLLNISDLFVFPSLTEGFPLAVLEAMAAARPIVAFRLPSFRGCVEEGRTGLMAPPGDAAAFTRAVMEVLEDAGRMIAMGREAHDVARRFTQEATSGALVRIYESLLRNAHAPTRGAVTGTAHP